MLETKTGYEHQSSENIRTVAADIHVTLQNFYSTEGNPPRTALAQEFHAALTTQANEVKTTWEWAQQEFISPLYTTYIELGTRPHWKSGLGPLGRINIDTTYPLALMMLAEDKRDVQRLGRSKNLAGQYSVLYFDRRPLPIIISGPDDQERVIRHEIAHAENHTFIKALVNAQKLNLWGSDINMGNDHKKIFRKSLHHQYRRQLAESTDDGEWRGTLQPLLARAKDELLAELHATGSMDHYMTHLVDNKKLYGYLAETVKSWLKPNLYNLVQYHYARILFEEVNYIQSYLDKTGTNSGEELEITRWILAQIPLGKWKESGVLD